MIRGIFFVLFAIALIEGFSVFSPPLHKANPVGFVMEGSGLNSVQDSNQRKIQQQDTKTGNDLAKIRWQMDNLALDHDKFLDMIHHEQQDLKPNSSQQQTQDLIEEERERATEQQQISRQRMQDEEQLIIDQRLRQNQ